MMRIMGIIKDEKRPVGLLSQYEDSLTLGLYCTAIPARWNGTSNTITLTFQFVKTKQKITIPPAYMARLQNNW